MNSETNQILMIFQEVFEELLNFKNINGELSYQKDFDAESIKHIILSKLDRGCLSPSPNIIILEPGADEAIYRRLIKGRKKWPKLRSHLGQ